MGSHLFYRGGKGPGNHKVVDMGRDDDRCSHAFHGAPVFITSKVLGVDHGNDRFFWVWSNPSRPLLPGKGLSPVWVLLFCAGEGNECGKWSRHGVKYPRCLTVRPSFAT